MNKRISPKSMPRLTTGRSSSPDSISFHPRRKPSTPIEIPKRGRLSLVSPIDEPRSPDLIFEMSPISPVSPLSPSNLNNNTPFVYSVPVFIPPCRTNTGTHFSAIRSRQRVMPSLTAAPISAIQNAWRTQPIHAEPEGVNDDHDSHDGIPQSERKVLPRVQSTTRITGFIPIVEHCQPLMTDHPSKPIGRLSPPPRRASHSSSPWILPSNDAVEDDIAYSQMDPSLFEFKQHLLRRIENRYDASRFLSFHSCLQ